MIRVPAPREVIDRINAAAHAASETWNDHWQPDDKRIEAYRRWEAAEELSRYLFEPVSIFRTVDCFDCKAPARTVCTDVPMEERNPYYSQRPLCPSCRKAQNEAYRWEY